MPEWFNKEFPNWKKNLWGAVRAFSGGFLASLAMCLVSINTDTVFTQNFWMEVVLRSALTGGFVFLGKWLRDEFYASEVAQRLPI